MLPKFKKHIRDFLVGEEGKISKKSVVVGSIVLGAVAASVGQKAAAFTYTTSTTSAPCVNTTSAAPLLSRHQLLLQLLHPVLVPLLVPPLLIPVLIVVCFLVFIVRPTHVLDVLVLARPLELRLVQLVSL